AGSPARVCIEDHAMHYAERAQSHASRLLGCGQRRIQTAEVGARDASTFTRSAIMAASAIKMILRKNRGAPNGQHPFSTEVFRQFRAYESLGTVQLHGWQKFAGGKLRES